MWTAASWMSLYFSISVGDSSELCSGESFFVLKKCNIKVENGAEAGDHFHAKSTIFPNKL